MNVMQWAENFLYVVSAVLYYPVTLGLVALVFYMLILIGGLAREHLDRKRGQRPAIDGYRGRLTTWLAEGARENRDLELEILLQEAERQLGKAVERARFIVRSGPGLGLMGTLIPMGVALASLAQGSMPEMAQHMVSAFTAAVVGLGSGVVAFAIALVREQWIKADVTEMRYLTERASRDSRLPDAHETPSVLMSARPAEETP
ncbi:MAG: MotA/TolQ/ExbB proton channel family protein [Gammaproteobacteria bacterium]|nr:MotA/TolQ/ExbB proton channel family protein [Gammaproteobacteria bacterium]